MNYRIEINNPITAAEDALKARIAEALAEQRDRALTLHYALPEPEASYYLGAFKALVRAIETVEEIE